MVTFPCKHTVNTDGPVNGRISAVGIGTGTSDRDSFCRYGAVHQPAVIAVGIMATRARQRGGREISPWGIDQGAVGGIVEVGCDNVMAMSFARATFIVPPTVSLFQPAKVSPRCKLFRGNSLGHLNRTGGDMVLFRKRSCHRRLMAVKTGGTWVGTFQSVRVLFCNRTFVVIF
jgi:hypothetical protein